ncbi:MAG: hypothetical protein QGG40_15335, partial [Myxococcota bacterium]|nr:hypothetical protein [Myxococcota bacterium]
HKGRPLYAYAREGREVEVEARPRRIDSIDLLDLSPGRVRVRIQCGRGTYARVLADEIATALGSAGHLDALRRTRSGPFHESACLGIEQLSMIVAERKDWQVVLKPGRSEDRVPWRPRDVVRSDLEAWVTRPLEALGHLPRAPVSAAEAARIRSGGSPPVPPLAVGEGELYLAVEGDEVIAVAKREASGPRVARVVPR